MRNAFTALVSIAALATLSNCASTASTQNLKAATVLEVHHSIYNRGTSAAPGIMGATQLGIIGSQVGTGAAAHVVGAAVGALAGGGLGYAAARDSATTQITSVYLVLDDGSRATIGAARMKHTPHRGERVWVRCDAAGRPVKLVPGTAAKS